MKTPVVNAVNCSLVVIMCLLVWWLHPNTGEVIAAMVITFGLGYTIERGE